MVMPSAFYVALLYLAAGLLTAFALYALFRRTQMVAAYLGGGLLMLCALWMLTYALEVSSPELPLASLWRTLRVAVSGAATPFWLNYVVEYIVPPKRPSRLVLQIVWGIGGVFFLLNLTNPLHHWMYRINGITLEYIANLKIDHTTLFWIFTAYNYLVFLFAFYLLFTAFTRRKELYRSQIVVLSLVAFFPGLGGVLDAIGLNPLPPFDASTLFLSFTAPFIVWVLYQMRQGDILSTSQELIIESMDDGVLVLNPDLRVVYLNPAAMRLCGKNSNHATGQPVNVVCPAWESIGALPLTLPSEGVKRELRLDVEGEERIFEVRISPLFDWRSQLISFVAALHDITIHKDTEQKLLFDTMHDSLTHLYNRTYFTTRLENILHRIHSGHPGMASVLFLDYDDFKAVNDSRGHSFGDQILIQSTEVLQSCLRASDVLARFGGDEFVILIDEIHHLNDVLQVANRIFEHLKSPIRINNEDIYISTSIGIVVIDSAYQTAEDVLRDADIAMYIAKANGRNRYEIFQPAMHSGAAERLALENALRQAIERKEFEIHYQPVVALTNGKIIGFEALLRWNSPELGLLPPTNFISQADDAGLLVPIGRWMMREACRQMARWQRKYPSNPPLTISINIAAHQLSQQELPEEIETILRETNLVPGSLRLEITENTVMTNVNANIVKLKRLKSMGVQVEIDDFGTGYSALQYLARLPIDAIKIDRTFISRIDSDENYLRVVQTILGLARNLGLAVVAKGVESESQWVMLRAMGVEYGQGYLFNRPVEVEDVGALIEAQLGLGVLPSGLRRKKTS